MEQRYILFTAWCLLAILIGSTGLRAQTVTTYSGKVLSSGLRNGTRAEALFNNPHGIAVDLQGNVYIADRFNHSIRKIAADGAVSTLAGSGNIGNANGKGTAASFYEPWDLTVDKQGNVYVADYRNNLIRRITPDGTVTTLAGSGAYGILNGQGTAARFGNPSGIAIDANGDLIVVDHNTHLIRKVTPSGMVTTIAGVAYTRGKVDGAAATAQFNYPYGLTVDRNNNIIIADEHNHSIRRITPAGIVSTIAGTGTIGTTNGNGNVSQFNYPWDVATDEEGSIYVMDGYNSVVRKITGDGKVSTYIGTFGVKGATDGEGANVSFNGATAIVYYAAEKAFFIGDAYNHLIRKMSKEGTVPPPPPPVNLVLEAGATNACEGQRLKFTVTPAQFTSYTFYDSTTVLATMANNSYETTSLKPGEHRIKVTVRSSTGVETTSNTVVINIRTRAKADFEYMADQRKAYTVSFTNKSANATAYSWNFGNGKTSAEPSPVHVYDRAGSFTVTLVAQSASGCNDTLRRTITVQEPEKPDVFVPSAFTPNGDGNNDKLIVRGRGIEKIAFRIYNQWGQLVFETYDLTEGWDGRSGGAMHPVGTYVYVAEATLQGGSTMIKKGHVNLIR